ncbi:MAG: hypothetical protein WAM94_19025, partial [Chromatiaceae bacterium]
MSLSDENARRWLVAGVWHPREAGLLLSGRDPWDYGPGEPLIDEEREDVESILEQMRHISDPIELALRDLSINSETDFDPKPREWLELAAKAELPIPASLKPIVPDASDKKKPPVARDNTLPNIIGAMLALCLDTDSKGKKLTSFTSQAEIINALLER